MINADNKETNFNNFDLSKFKDIDLTGFKNLNTDVSLFDIDLDLTGFKNIELKGFTELPVKSLFNDDKL